MYLYHGCTILVGLLLYMELEILGNAYAPQSKCHGTRERQGFRQRAGIM